MNDALKLLLINLDRSTIDRASNRFEILIQETLEVENCANAIAVLEQQAFDCALINGILPDGSVVEFVKRVRDRAFPVALIVLTQHDDGQLAVEVLRAGAHDYCADVSSGELARRIRDAVRLHRAEQLAQEAFEKLTTSEERYRLVVEGSNDGIWDWYICQNEVFCNDRMFEILGLNRDQLGTAQAAFFALIHPDDQAQVLDAMRSHLQQQTPFDVEFRLRHASGHYLYCTSRGKAQRDRSGRFFRMSGIVTDITQRKADEQRIVQLNRELERRVTELQTLLNVIPIGIGIGEDPECDRIQVNAALRALLGISPTEDALKIQPNSQSLPYKIFQNGREIQPDELPMQQSARTGIAISGFEMDILREEGEPITLLAEVAPLFDEMGQTRGCVGAFLDITERKRTEDAQRFLANASALLSTSLDGQTILQSLAQLTIPDLADWCLIHLLQNDCLQLAALHHADSDKVAAFNRVRDRYPLALDDAEGIPKVLRTGQPQFYPNLTRAEVTARFAEDDDHAVMLQSFGFCSAMIVPLLARGRVLGAITLAYAESGRHYTAHHLEVAEDLARRAALAIDNAKLFHTTQQVGQNLRRAIVTLIQQNQAVENQRHQIELQNLKLKEAAQLKSQFLATISHELRTPMNAIMGFSQLLIRQKTLTPSQMDMVNRIFNNSKNLLALINDILDLSKIEAGQLDFKVERFNIAILLNATVENLKSLAHSKQLMLEVDSQLNNPWVVNDSFRLKQVLLNLLSNAIKFTDEGGVQVTLNEQGDYIAIAVKDTGAGIAPENLDHIFEEFRQLDQTIARKHPGTGLGLAITKSLVQMMQGTISVESELGVGSTFRIVFPRTIVGDRDPH